MDFINVRNSEGLSLAEDKVTTNVYTSNINVSPNLKNGTWVGEVWDFSTEFSGCLLYTSINGVKVLITEANLLDYAGMWLESSIGGKLRAVFPHYPKEKEIKGDRDEYVHSRENFIAWYSSPTEFPLSLIHL